MPFQSKQYCDFGPFRVDPVDRELRLGDERVALTPKAFDTMMSLIEHRGRVIPKERLLDLVWPGTFVAEATLSQNIHTLRKALGQKGSRGPYIETVPRRGYRWVAKVRHTPMPVTGEAGPLIRKLAVLPLARFGGAAEHEFLGLGVADALISRLGSLESLTIRPTSAILKYADEMLDPLAAGRDLGVDAILHGTIQESGDRMRVSVQLVEVAGAVTLWSDRFDVVSADVFSIEDKISQRVADTLRIELHEERDRLSRPSAVGTAAHQAYVKGRYFWNKRSEDGLNKALEYFEQALALAPGYPRAYSGVADSLALLPLYGDVKPHDVFPRAREAAASALALDESSAEGHASLAYVRLFYEWSWNDAEASFLRAIELDPGYPTARHWYAFLLSAQGRHERAIEMADLALDLDPLSLAISSDLALILYFARRYPEAIRQYERTLELDPGFAYAHFGLALVRSQLGMSEAAVANGRRAVELSGESTAMLAAWGYALAIAGLKDEAAAVLDRLESGGRRHHVPAGRAALVRIALDDRLGALSRLEQACEERSRFVIFLGEWAAFDALRSEPRYTALLERVRGASFSPSQPSTAPPGE